MTQSDKEKIAIVLIDKYRSLVDSFKKDNVKSMAGQIQIIEMNLYVLIKDRPIAKKFFEKILEYRRSGTKEIRKFEIPEIRIDPSDEKVSLSDEIVKQEHGNISETVEKNAKENETKKEECPFEF